MIRLLFRNLHLCDQTQRLIPTHLCSFYSSIPKSRRQDPQNPTSLTVSFLTESCGLSLPEALSASRKLRIKSKDKPNAVLALLKDHNFTDTQITKLITKLPGVLLINPDSVIKPKLEFFLSVGYSAPVLAILISSTPTLLTDSLDMKLRDNFFFLKSLMGSSAAVSEKNSMTMSLLLRCNFENTLRPKLKILQDLGVPLPNIVTLVTRYPRVLTQNSDHFKNTVSVLREMGLDPKSKKFVRAIFSMCALSPSLWVQKLAVYKSLGWSEEETISAFIKHPLCMNRSEEKIRKIMDFCVKKLRLEPSFVSAWPTFLSYSLEKRIVPRCAVMKFLSSKGLVSKNWNVRSFLAIDEENFVEKFVTKHQFDVPEVVQVYEGKMNFGGLGEDK